MDVATVAVAISSFATGLILSTFLRARSSPEVGRPQADPPILRDEVASLRLMVEEAVDHMDHLYDRLRKRRMAEEAPKGGGGTQTPILDGKAALRAKAAALGLLPGVRAVERTDT